MDRAPLPPHERPWRHPSELGPPLHEPTSTSGRALIVTTGTLSLLLIGLLALSMTPDRGAGPVAVESTADGDATGIVALERPSLPMVTPLGDEGWAVTTSGAVGARSGLMAARLPSGDIVDVEIVRRNAESGVTLVSLPEQTNGYQLAASTPGPSDTVVVQGAEPQIVPMIDVAGLDVDEGAAVLDDAGALVGICTKVADGVSVMTVSTMPGTPVATPTARRPSTSSATTVPSTPTPSTTTPTPTSTATATTTHAATSLPAPTVPVATDPSGVSGDAAATTAPG